MPTTPAAPPPPAPPATPAPAGSPAPSRAPAPAAEAKAPAEVEQLLGEAPEPKESKEGEKPTDATKAEASKPIELKLPDGADPNTLAPFLEVATKHKLSQEQAQALVDFDRDRQVAADKSFSESWRAEQQKWVEAAKADPEIGAGKPEVLKANLELAKRAIQQFGGRELAKELLDTGLGNNPVWVRAFVRIGKAMADDSIAGTAGGPAAGPSGEEAFHRAIYPTMFKKES